MHILAIRNNCYLSSLIHSRNLRQKNFLSRCYHLKSCSVRVIKNRECPIEPNNYIDHTLFTKNDEECKSK